jgi:hypothetical protein
MCVVCVCVCVCVQCVSNVHASVFCRAPRVLVFSVRQMVVLMGGMWFAEHSAFLTRDAAAAGEGSMDMRRVHV